jgi:Na+/H+ antiporter NhaC
MKYISNIIRWNFYAIFSVFVIFTVVSFLYHYYSLKQSPTDFFSWWFGHIKSFDYLGHILYFIVPEVLLIIAVISSVRHQGTEDLGR